MFFLASLVSAGLVNSSHEVCRSTYGRVCGFASFAEARHTPNPPTNIVNFRGFDSSIISFLRGGILRPIGNFPEILSQAMLAGIMLVGRLGVRRRYCAWRQNISCLCHEHSVTIFMTPIRAPLIINP